MRIEILEGFRDKILKTVTTRHGGVLLFAGQADPAVVAAVRDSIPDTIILFYLFPGKTDENKLSSLLSHGKNMTLFSSLEDDQFPHEKAGILLTLKPSENTCLKADNSIEEKYLHTIEKINEAVGQALRNAEQSMSTGLIYFRSSLCNLKAVFNSPRKMLKSNATAVPAVICCGGPSFSASIKILKKYESKIAIFAMARTADLLINEGIMPDVVVHIDPFYDVSWSEKASDKKCILAATLSVPPALSSKFENIIWLNGSSIAVNSYVKEKAPQLLLEISISQTVTTAAIALAAKSGFGKIILAGSDLCLASNGQIHANESPRFKYENTLEVDSLDGGKVLTSIELDDLRKGIENYVDEYLPGSVRIYNGSARGAAIRNIRHVPLETFLAENVGPDKNITLEQYPADTPVPWDFKEITEKLYSLATEMTSMASAAESLFRAHKSGNARRIAEYGKAFERVAEEGERMQRSKDFRYFAGEIEYFAEGIQKKAFIREQSPLIRLPEFIRRHLFMRDLYLDAVSDLEKEEFPSGPKQFTAFRNYALGSIAANNPAFSEYISKEVSPGFVFDMSFHTVFLPNIIKYRNGGRTVFASSIYDLEQKAKAFAESLEKQYSFDPTKNAIVFPAPVNYQNIVETARKFPDADMMIVEPWPEFLKQLISSAMFFHELPEKTVVAEAGDLNGLVSATIKNWQAAGKRILVVNTPENNGIKEAATLTDAIGRMLL